MFLRTHGGSYPLDKTVVGAYIPFHLVQETVDYDMGILPTPRMPVVTVLTFLWATRLGVSAVADRLLCLLAPDGVPLSSLDS